MLDVSEATVRRDLNTLDDRRLVARTHGGVALLGNDDEPHYHSKLTTLLAEKRRIGAAVSTLLQPHQVVGCTGGTTVVQVMKALRSKPNLPLRVVTNAVNVAMELAGAEEIEILLTGGTLRKNTYELVGNVAERTLADVVFDVALVGVDGISLEYGLTTFNHAESYVTRSLTERAKEVWVVADHSKLGQVRPAVIAPFDSVTRLITDSGAPAEVVERYRARGADVVLT